MWCVARVTCLVNNNLLMLCCQMMSVYLLQYAFLVPAAALFGWGIIIFFALVPSPEELGKQHQIKCYVLLDYLLQTHVL